MLDIDNLDELAWRKSSFSGVNGCVEAARIGADRVAVRDSKNPSQGVQIYDFHEWRSFLSGVRSGEFDDLADPAGSISI